MYCCIFVIVVGVAMNDDLFLNIYNFFSVVGENSLILIGENRIM